MNISRERWESNPGLQGEKRERYLCAMPPLPTFLIVFYEGSCDSLALSSKERIVRNFVALLSLRSRRNYGFSGDNASFGASEKFSEDNDSQIIQLEMLKKARGEEPINKRLSPSSLSLSLTHTRTHTLSLSLSLSL